MRVFIFTIVIYITQYACQSSSTCGIVGSSLSSAYEGPTNIETYPWLGLLIYAFGPGFGEANMSATVVLVSKQVAIASALDIDNFPKVDFRENSRVILGSNCSGPYFRVIEYIFHPEFSTNYYSSLAIIQLQSSKKLSAVTPICPPPLEFQDINIYAMTLTHECSSSIVTVYKMKYVGLDKCIDYYRRNDLDVESLWPRHVACAQSLQGGNCLWENGAILVSNQQGRWHLLGVGVYGPGCEAPSRFLDYYSYYEWAEKSVKGIGRVSISRLASNHLILRRSAWKIQRWGPCDDEETTNMIYSDYKYIIPKSMDEIRFNLSLNKESQYSCISIHVLYGKSSEENEAQIDIFPYTNVLKRSDHKTTLDFNINIKIRKPAAYILKVFGKSVKSVYSSHENQYHKTRVRVAALPWPHVYRRYVKV